MRGEGEILAVLLLMLGEEEEQINWTIMLPNYLLEEVEEVTVQTLLLRLLWLQHR